MEHGEPGRVPVAAGVRGVHGAVVRERVELALLLAFLAVLGLGAGFYLATMRLAS
jgi:hypothetical protein